MWVGGMRMSTIATSGRASRTCRSSVVRVLGLARRRRRPRRASRRTIPSRVSITSSATTTRTGSPRGASRRPNRVAPPSAPTRSARWTSGEAARGAVVLDRDHERLVGRTTLDARRRWRSAPGGVVDRLARPPRRRPSRPARRTARRRRRRARPASGASSASVASAARETGLGEDRRVDAVRELAQLLERRLRLVDRRREQRREPLVARRPRRAARASRRS